MREDFLKILLNIFWGNKILAGIMGGFCLWRQVFGMILMYLCLTYSYFHWSSFLVLADMGIFAH